MDWEKLVSASQEVTTALTSFVFTAISVVVGCIFVFNGIKKMVEHSKGGNPHESVFAYVAINLATGAALLQFSFFVSALVMSVFGAELQPPSNALSYMPDKIKGTPMLDAMITAGSMWVAVIGAISIFRGFVLWNSLARGQAAQGAGWKGFWHIVFGTLTVNIPGTISLFFG